MTSASTAGSLRDRSRSPARSDEWISREVAKFGRHADKRPVGLIVDSSGSFNLENLMQVWGTPQFLKEMDVIVSLQRNCWRSTDGTRRFEITNSAANGVIVKTFAASNSGLSDTDSPAVVVQPWPAALPFPPLPPPFPPSPASLPNLATSREINSSERAGTC